ncbi:MAG: tetratricopeptide repeat protein, partial [Elusimicrobiota bacterium]
MLKKQAKALAYISRSAADVNKPTADPAKDLAKSLINVDFKHSDALGPTIESCLSPSNQIQAALAKIAAAGWAKVDLKNVDQTKINEILTAMGYANATVIVNDTSITITIANNQGQQQTVVITKDQETQTTRTSFNDVPVAVTEAARQAFSDWLALAQAMQTAHSPATPMKLMVFLMSQLAENNGVVGQGVSPRQSPENQKQIAETFNIPAGQLGKLPEQWQNMLAAVAMRQNETATAGQTGPPLQQAVLAIPFIRDVAGLLTDTPTTPLLPSMFSALSIHLRWLMESAGISQEATAEQFATAIIALLTGKENGTVVTAENASPEGQSALKNAEDLNGRLSAYLKTKNIPSSKMVVTNSNNTFVKYGNRICGMPVFLYHDTDGSVTLYIQQQFINALYAEQATRLQQQSSALPRGDLLDQFVTEEVDELFAITDMLAANKQLTPVQAYFSHHDTPNNRPPAHHPLIVTIADQVGQSILGIDNTYQPTVLRPEQLLNGTIMPEVDVHAPRNPIQAAMEAFLKRIPSPLPSDTFSPRYFADDLPRTMLSYFAELMDHIQFKFVDARLLGSVKKQGFSIETHAPIEIAGGIFTVAGKMPRKITVTTTVTIAADITFVQLLLLVTTLYQRMLDDSKDKSEQYRQLLQKKLTDIDRIAKNFIYAAEYLESVKDTWPKLLALDPRDVKELNAYIGAVITGFRKLTAGYVIKSDDSPQQRKATAESWLGIDQEWLETFVKRIPQSKRLQFIKRLFNASQNRWARAIAYETTAPARQLDAAVMERGGRVLDSIRARTDQTKTLLQEIDEELAKQTLDPNTSETRITEEIIKIVQKKVGSYYDNTLFSGGDPRYLALEAQKFAKALGIDPSQVAGIREISPTSIIKSQHMVCMMQAYLCGRILQQKGIEVYWLNVIENYSGDTGAHAAILAKLPNGLFRIVDSVQPLGAGAIPAEFLSQDEVQQGLADALVFSKILDPRQHHYRIAITQFESGALASAHNNLGGVSLPAITSSIEEKTFRDALILNPNDPAALLNLSDLLTRQGHVDQAEKLYRTLIRLSPQMPLVWRGLGILLLQQHRYKEAQSAFSNELRNMRTQLGDDNDDFIWNNLGMASAAISEFDNAETAFRRAIELYPRTIYFNNLIG